MAWSDILDRKYAIETSHSTDSIIDSLKKRIDDAKKKTSLFSFESIQYKRMEIDDYRMIIKRSQSNFNPFGGNGVIVVHFNQTNIDPAKISAEIRPFRTGLWVLLGCLILITTFATWLVRGMETLILLIPVWIVFTCSACLSVILFRYGAKNYLKEILSDIGVSDYSLIREK